MTSRGSDGGWLATLVPQPGPRGATAGEVWRRLDEPARRRLRRAATDPRAASDVHDEDERAVVRDLAASRARRRAADVVAPAVTGLLVLSTVWGFGRAVFPAEAGWWLLAGSIGPLATVATGLRRAASRRRAATATLAIVTPAGDRTDGGRDTGP